MRSRALTAALAASAASIACVLAFLPAAAEATASSAPRAADPVLGDSPDLAVSSNAFDGLEPAVEGAFTKPLAELPGGVLEGEVVFIGRGCPGDPYLSDPAGKIALIERGVCLFVEKLERAFLAGAIGAIVYNFEGQETLVVMGGAFDVDLPGVFVRHSAGVALRDGDPPVTARVGPVGAAQLLEYLEDSIATLFDEGLINRGMLTSLLKKLELAQARIEQEQYAQAIGQLLTFIRQVQGLVDRGVIAPEDGALLIDAAERLIDTIPL